MLKTSQFIDAITGRNHGRIEVDDNSDWIDSDTGNRMLPNIFSFYSERGTFLVFGIKETESGWMHYKCTCGTNIIEDIIDDKVYDCNHDEIDIAQSRMCKDCMVNECIKTESVLDPNDYCWRTDCKHYSTGGMHIECRKCFFRIYGIDQKELVINYQPREE